MLVSGTRTVEELERQVDRLSRLLGVARSAGMMRNLDEVLDHIAEQVTKVIGADACSIFLVDEKRGEIWSRVHLRRSQEIRFPLGRGLAGHTIATGESLLIESPYEDPRFHRAIDEKTGYQTRSVLTVPLRDFKDRPIGCFEVLNKLEGRFTLSDLEFLEAFASHASIAIVSAQLRHDLELKVQQIETVNRVERSLHESGDLEHLMEAVLERATEALEAEGSAILIHLPDQPCRFFSHRRGVPSDRMAPLEAPAVETVFAELKGSGCGYILGSPEGADGPISSSITVALRMESAAPAVASDVIGAVKVIDKREGAFTSSDLSLLQVFSAQISSALDRRRILEERERQKRLATVGTLASTIIHDFRNPMTSISGFTELLAMPDLDPEKRHRFCEIIQAEVGRCMTMARELLSYSRGERDFRFERIGVRVFFQEVLMVLENEMSRAGIRLEGRTPESGELVIDRDKMKRVLYNLSSNSLAVLNRGDRFAIDCSMTDESVEIRVSDTGPGIPESIRESLFEPFVTQDKKGGTGLGLSIARDIVEGHGGSIALDPTPGPGTTFLIRLPRHGKTPVAL